MNKCLKNLPYSLVVCSLIFICIFLIGCHCGSPVFEFTIENQTSELLIITVNTSGKSGAERNAKPGEKMVINWQRDLSPIIIIAKYSNGDTVFFSNI